MVPDARKDPQFAARGLAEGRLPEDRLLTEGTIRRMKETKTPDHAGNNDQHHGLEEPPEAEAETMTTKIPKKTAPTRRKKKSLAKRIA